MRAKEFINEAESGKVPKEAENAMPGARKTRDPGGYDRTNHLNRFGMALASADGKGGKIEMDSYSWAEKYNTIHPYTKEEDDMVKQAMKTVPTDQKHVVPDRRSKEDAVTNKISPITGFKGFGK